MKVSFQVVKAKRTIRGNCIVCGKKMTRSKTFEHTVNPFNKNLDGTVKTYLEVLKDVNNKADQWDPILYHNKCK